MQSLQGSTASQRVWSRMPALGSRTRGSLTLRLSMQADAVWLAAVAPEAALVKSWLQHTAGDAGYPVPAAAMRQGVLRSRRVRRMMPSRRHASWRPLGADGGHPMPSAPSSTSGCVPQQEQDGEPGPLDRCMLASGARGPALGLRAGRAAPPATSRSASGGMCAGRARQA
ncbi:hypothetical protein FA09DRAFT_229237 [Tilletiopsis washingtonensis]|uniref:Uncharacterized protein n=1 Tax=Tilletiopsis washingtonensis TaxID=58919 RepID=A0A316ZC68_9BASI|nr:hypothetical protein FA09DRAFT_229237 [Tilletiopsis washingtonensis]PWN99377.1 hypothetical protein FA09DRAFT_229237 [Tilletiopsis washingtonensis]